MSTDAKDLRLVSQPLGEPREIAATAAKEYARAHFCRRYPILMFILLPVVALPISWAACLIVVLLTCKAFGLETGGPGIGSGVWQFASVNAPLIVLVLIAAPIGLVAALFTRLAAKAGVSWRWTLSACGILAVIGGAAIAKVVLPGVAEHGKVFFGLSLGTQPSAAQLLQFALPLAIGAWAVFRQVHPRQRHRGLTAG